VTGEMCRSEALERRRGRTFERDERGASVAQHSPPRWRWHALEPHTGKGLA
jgi:hypothetical protein